jgi:hypothetical protein
MVLKISEKLEKAGKSSLFKSHFQTQFSYHYHDGGGA